VAHKPRSWDPRYALVKIAGENIQIVLRGGDAERIESKLEGETEPGEYWLIDKKVVPISWLLKRRTVPEGKGTFVFPEPFAGGV